MNTDELAKHLQKLFSEKLKMNFGLDVFKDALGHLDQVEIGDLSVYVDSLAKFGSDDSVIRKMLEAVCSEKECGAQLNELLQRWNGIFPHNPIPVPTHEVFSAANNGLIAATVVLGILSASLLGLGAGYMMYQRKTGALNLERHFRNSLDMISIGTSTQDLSHVSPDAGKPVSRPGHGTAGVSGNASPNAGKPVSPGHGTAGVSGNASPNAGKPVSPGHGTAGVSGNASPNAGKPVRPGYGTADVSGNASPNAGKPVRPGYATADVSRNASPDAGKPVNRDSSTSMQDLSRNASPDAGKLVNRDSSTSMQDLSRDASSGADKSSTTRDSRRTPSPNLNEAKVDQSVINRSRI
ncbi:hypothetical protein [Neorickettsia findlayensis]|uniref:Uncharacterized protein n=1 Tax=Neorickettsia findlayensis TaxID=2686014 RepID=A0A6P1G8U4_9RICK|nr:hypothetical protein [Neorickettsia findlayensis]QHD64896.1 hypothetical protein GP480_00155 [Neorickettsia findlayensis]